MSLAELRQHYDPGPLREEDLAADPFDQFRQWFDEAQAAEILEPNAFTLATATPDGIPSARTVLLKGVDLAPPLPNTPLPDTTLPEAALPDAGAAGERTPTPPHLATLEPTSASLYHTPGWAAEVPPPRGFVFYTNYNSAKAHDLAANPLAAMNFYWDVMARCVRIVGQVQKVSPAETAAYFHSRPHASQLGAWASEQSQVIPNRETLTRRFNELQEQYPEPPEGQSTIDTSSTVPVPDFWGGYRVVPTRFEFWQGQPSRLHDRLRYSLTHSDASEVWHIDRLSP